MLSYDSFIRMVMTNSEHSGHNMTLLVDFSLKDYNQSTDGALSGGAGEEVNDEAGGSFGSGFLLHESFH